MQPTQKDPFDYKLRPKAEVLEEFKYFMPDFAVQVAYKKYMAGDTRAEENLDNRDRVVIILHV